MAQMTMVQAINDALKSELKRDEDVLVFGEDVGVNGGVFRVTEGLQKEFGEDRVFDTPLAAESGIGGLHRLSSDWLPSCYGNSILRIRL